MKSKNSEARPVGGRQGLALNVFLLSGWGTRILCLLGTSSDEEENLLISVHNHGWRFTKNVELQYVSSPPRWSLSHRMAGLFFARMIFSPFGRVREKLKSTTTPNREIYFDKGKFSVLLF